MTWHYIGCWMIWPGLVPSLTNISLQPHFVFTLIIYFLEPRESLFSSENSSDEALDSDLDDDAEPESSTEEHTLPISNLQPKVALLDTLSPLHLPHSRYPNQHSVLQKALFYAQSVLISR